MDAPPPPADTVRTLVRALEGAVDTTEAARCARELDALFADHQAGVYAVCLRFLGEREAARDIAQEVLLIGYEKLPEFRGTGSFRGWLYGIARNKCMGLIRKRKELLTEDGVIDPTDASADALRALRREERAALLLEVTAELTAEEQEAIYLRYVERLPVDRITDILEIDTASGARGLLQRCKRKLRRTLQQRLEEMDVGTSFLRSSL